MTTPTPETPASHDCATCPDCIHDGHKCCGCYDGDCCQAAETPAGGLTTETRDEWAGALMRRWGVDDGDQDAYDAACADVDVLAPLVAAAAAQARAEDQSRIEAAWALANEWRAVGDSEGATAADDRVIGAWYGAGTRLRAALLREYTATEDGDNR